MSIVVNGKNGIRAEVVQDSISPSGKRVTTLNVKYGLIIHAESLRHRLLSNSVASNRAIPMKSIRKQVLDAPYIPVWFGAAQKGMVADNEMKHKKLARRLWIAASKMMCGVHWTLEKLGAHKEFANRLLNPWQFVSQTITATEWENYEELRIHKDAQKDIQEIARCIKDAKDQSFPMEIIAGELHVPYVQRVRDEKGVLSYFDNDGVRLTKEQAIKASAARTARSSYNNHDKSDANFKNDEGLYDMLVASNPKHLSPCEHQCTPIVKDHVFDFNKPNMQKVFAIDGVTHIDKLGRVWSGNFIGWVQHRQTLGLFEDEGGVK